MAFAIGDRVQWTTKPHGGTFYPGTVAHVYTNQHGSTRVQVKADPRKGEYSGHKTVRPYRLNLRQKGR